MISSAGSPAGVHSVSCSANLLSVNAPVPPIDQHLPKPFLCFSSQIPLLEVAPAQFPDLSVEIITVARPCCDTTQPCPFLARLRPVEFRPSESAALAVLPACHNTRA